MRTLKDARDALRSFARRPLITAAILASLAFGIGANTAIFSILNTLMFRPLPVREPGTLFQMLHAGDGGTFESSTYALYEHVAGHARTIAGALLLKTSTVKVVVDDQADAVVGQQVTGGYFDLLGIRPHIGILIQPRDEPGSAPNRVAVISHRYWVRRFGSDPGVLGRTITIDRLPHTIIGVTAPEFFGLQVGRYVDVTVPIDGSDDREYWQSKSLVVRLAPGVSRDAAMIELNALFHGYISADKTLSARARVQGFRWLDLSPSASGLPEFRDRYGKSLQAALVIVSALLLLACANLASLFLARASERQRDLAVRLALGATRIRLARQLLCEAILISLIGGTLGLVVAWWGTNVLLGFVPDLGLPAEIQVRPDMKVFLFAFMVSLLTGLSIGVAPASLVGRLGLSQVLAASGRTVTADGRAFKALMVAQVAVSTILVVAATLFTVTLNNLKAQPLGFVADGVLTLTLDADGSAIEGERLSVVQRQILENLAALPGVQSATFATIPPISSNEDGKPISIPGVTFSTPDDGVLQVNTVGPNFFETFGIRIVKGRGITASDHGAAPRIAVVSESMARYYFRGSEAVGRRIDVGRGPNGKGIEIVGVAADVRYKGLRTPPPRMAYVAAFQRDAEEECVFALRTAGDPVNWIQAAQREMKAVVPGIPATDVNTMVRQRDRALVTERLLAMVSASFGGLALILVGIGVYGVVSHSVSRRTSELGLRIALGANRTGLLWLVVHETLALTTIASITGTIVALLASSWISSFLFGIQPAEAWVYSATIVLLILIALLATLGPTVRAMRIDPVDALRSQ